MKIGIITWFKYENYGTKLQAFALQRYLRNHNFSCYMIDFNVDSVGITLKHKFKDNIKLFLDDKLYRLIRKINRRKFNNKSEKMTNFTYNNSEVTQYLQNEQEYISKCNEMDLLVIGSDQIWNPAWYHEYYYADFPDISTPKMSYAASFGSFQLNDEVEKNIKKSTNNLDIISVRETKGKDILENLIDKKVEVVCDPTLLIEKKEWDKLAVKPSIKNKYVLCYFLTDNSNHWAAARKFAKKKGLELVIIPQRSASFFQSKKENVMMSAGVEEFLGLIKYADYIITDSFHGCVFSLILNKNFTVIERHDGKKSNCQNERIYNLLNIVDLQKCYSKYNTKFIHDENVIEYDSVNSKLDKYIEESKSFINDSINKLAKNK